MPNSDSESIHHDTPTCPQEDTHSQVSPDAAPADSGDHPTQLPIDATASDHDHVPLASQSDDDDFSEPAPSSTNAAKHSSTMSFARTVSHEVNWNDDDDADPDWNIGRQDVDPLKFMDDARRTNSFPAVPPVQNPETVSAHRRLPSTQVQDIMDHVEDEEQDHGGVTVGSSRFEEGVPLMADSENKGAFNDSFADDAGEGDDDFFNKASDGKPSNSGAAVSILERKSTIQVMGSLQNTEASKPEEAKQEGESQEDLAAKWAAAFADDDDFVLGPDKEVDPADFFGSDDEGFLEDDKHDPGTSTSQPASQPPAPATNGRYLPASLNLQTQAASTSPVYTQPSPSWHPQVPPEYNQPNQPLQSPYSSTYGASQPRQELPKAQSFADKSKGGYHSPYDLPMEVVKPKKRASTQNIQRMAGISGVPPPPRSSSMVMQGPPQRRSSGSSSSPPGSSHGGAPLMPPQGQKPLPPKSKESFFEELPMASRPRPSSRQGIGSPAQNSPYGPPSPAAPRVPAQGPSQVPPQSLPHGVPAAGSYVSSPLASPPQDGQANIPSLVPAPRVSPYAPMQANAHQPVPAVPAPSSNRYSPASSAPNAAVPPALSNRYSPAPGASKPMHSASTTVLPHLPRTSSPLAHFEMSNEKTRSPNTPGGEGAPVRSNSGIYNRIPSLPPTREVEEEPDIPSNNLRKSSSMSSTSSPTETKYPTLARHTPPPMYAASQTLSPPKRSNYAPQPAAGAVGQIHEFAPPPRSQTQSPGALYGKRSPKKPGDPIPRPSSVHSPSSPRTPSMYAPAPAPTAPVAVPSRPRGMSQNFNLIAPTDGREHDPLQRWKGAPVFYWGVGGTIVTSFPKDIPRYGGVNSAVPSVIRSPGEVKVKSVKDIQPLEERLSKFPGPLKGKSKKKETVAWLTAGIEGLEQGLPNLGFQSHVSHEDKRAVERVLLWKILRVFIENDGTLEGTENVERAVREILAPGLDGEQSMSPIYSTGRDVTALQESAMTRMQSDAVDSSTMELIRNALLRGDREKAVWAAVDKRLWGHAMIISRTHSPGLYMKVSQEFVRKEVNYPGHNNESLAALYGVLSGNYEECVDELVPVHARAGLQLIATSPSSGPVKDALDGLDKWRETLSLILSNRSPEDVRALNSLGTLLSGYGRAEAAHICFLFARNATLFGGLDDPKSHFVLLGADHRRQAEHFAKETEALLLSEVYEYGLSLSSGSVAGMTVPHLAAYKLQHAMTLAEYGHRDKALQYCEAISSAISSATRKSPYHHAILENSVEDLMKRLKQAPKEESNSWIPKPSMNKMSDSLMSRFNKFVSGDDNDDARSSSPTEGVESGPFARVAGGTPTISRSPSVSNFDMYGNASASASASGPAYGVGNMGGAPPATRTASRYAPAPSGTSTTGYQPSSSGYTPRQSLERTSSEFSRSAYEPNNAANGHGPQSREPSFSAASSQYQPTSPPANQPYGAMMSSNNGFTVAPVTETKSDIPTSAPPANFGYQPPSYGYEPPSLSQPQPSSSESLETNEPKAEAENNTGGYEPPSYGYEPPTYQPYQPEPSDDENGSQPKPKKKTIFDDDEDDIPAIKQQPQEKSKAEKDRENEELFRKAAEEDAKRAEAEKAQKKSGGWFSGLWGGKKEANLDKPKAVRANLGEQSSFVYDPELKRWVNKKVGAETPEARTATPPPPKGPMSRSVSGTPPPSHLMGPPPPMDGRATAPPPSARSFTPTPSGLRSSPSKESVTSLAAPPIMMRSASAASNSSAPPTTRPSTALSNASSIDDLLGPAMPRKPGGKKARKSGRYVDVMAKP